MVEGAVSRTADPLDDGPDDGAARQTLHVGIRAVCASKDPWPRLDRPGSRRIQTDGSESDRAVQPELQAADSPRRGAHAARARKRSGSDRGQYFPGRADAGSAVVQQAVSWLRAISGPGRRLLHVRLGHTSW